MALISDVDIIVSKTTANQGEIISFTTRTYNLTDEIQNIQTMVVLEGIDTLFNEQQEVSPGSVDNHHTFTMPSQTVTIGAYTFYLGTDGYYHSDGYERQVITLEGGGIIGALQMMMPMIMLAMVIPMVTKMVRRE